MRFEWDEKKNLANRRKHRVSFETATLVFEDPHAISVLERIAKGEERWQTVGMAGGVLVMFVAHTYRESDGEEVVRIISARKATPRERSMYEEGL
jgi:uncharacterized protein